MAIIISNTSITPAYFKDELTPYELQFILNELKLKEQSKWEKIRWIGYLTLLPNLKEGTSPTDLAAFDWENINKTIDTKAIMENSLAAFEKIKDKL